MDLLRRLDDFIISKDLFAPHESLLVAVSGGMDSMFLITYLHTKKYKIAVAHCNFGLRNEESDGDETLVKNFCTERNIPFHLQKFNTTQYAKNNGISIQMAARDLRYQWFNALCAENNYLKIITAHHKTDNAETILLNMVRGTVIKGLEGIKPKKMNLIRPLLCLSRNEIELAVKELKINYRDDSSNSSDKYHRNRIRLNVLPQLLQINPSFEDTLKTNSEFISETNAFISFYLDKLEQKLIKTKNELTLINIDKLNEGPKPTFVLYHLLSKFGFNFSVVKDISQALNGLTGKQFLSETHQLIINRGELQIEPIANFQYQNIEILSSTKSIKVLDKIWQFEVLTGNITLPKSNKEAVLDYDKLSFPLTIRPWKLGDKIVPLGMKGHKKISDILIDKKLSIFEKAKVNVLISNNEIIWVGGLVVSENYKVKPETKTCLRIWMD